jgi:hypothetical protein
MYYFLANRILIANGELDGTKTPLTMRLKEDAEAWVKTMNSKYDDRVFQCFYSNTEIKLHEDAKSDVAK